MLFVNYVNLDMIIKNKDSALTLIENQRELWIFVSSLYINIDYLLMLSAFLQANKMFKHFRIMEEDPNKLPRPHQDTTHYDRNWSSLFTLQNLLKHLEIILIRCFRLWPGIIFIFVMIQSTIYHLGEGPIWYELGNLF